MKSKGDEQAITATKASPGTRAESAERPKGGATAAGKALSFLTLCALAVGLARSFKAPPAAESSDANNEEREKIRFLLEQKLASLNAVANMCMTWWVSSVVFCGSILAAVWLQREEIVKLGVLFPLGIVLGIFFLGVVIFGAVMLWYSRGLKRDLSELAKPEDKVNFSNELLTFRLGMVIGTISFFFILLAWLGLWCRLSPGCQNFWLVRWCCLSSYLK